MEKFQQQFLEFAIEVGVLRFGEFVLKSGRKSPYFFNSGLFNSGARLAKLGQFYASAISNAGIKFDMLYGPAYKGIPLASAAVIALAEQHGMDVPYAFNRKEAKDHGEGGNIVGAPLQGNVLIIDDVITAGTSVRESVEIIKRAAAIPAGVVIALDRQELGEFDQTAVQEVSERFAMPVISIASLSNLIEYLESKQDQGQYLENIREYQNQYGCK